MAEGIDEQMEKTKIFLSSFEEKIIRNKHIQRTMNALPVTYLLRVNALPFSLSATK